MDGRCMMDRGIPSALAIALALLVPAWQRAKAQGPGGDPISSRSLPGPGSTVSSLGDSPGDGGGASDFSQGPGSGSGPGSDQPLFGGRPGASPTAPINDSTTGYRGGRAADAPSIEPPRALPFTEAPRYGTLAIPAGGEDEGPADGLTIDQAIERTIAANLDLRSRFLEIPQAQADILTAGLRANPIFYADTQLIPYGRFTEQRPGGQTQYDINVSIPLDLSRKRQARTAVACRAKRVLEAQYQDAVRLQIDNLYTAFVNVLAARETLLFAEASVQGHDRIVRVTEDLLKQGGTATRADVNRVKIQRDGAEIGLDDSRERLAVNSRILGEVLNLPPDQAEVIAVRGSLRDRSPPPPKGDPLIQAALASRPDLAAYRLGILRAEADVKLALANRYADIYVLLQPFTFQDNEPTGTKSAHSWGIGATVPLPISNRNQGNIQRARLNVTQAQIELAALERRVATEARQAEREYFITLGAIKRIEAKLLPAATQVLEDTERLYKGGEVDVVSYLNAQRSYNDVVQQYRDTSVRHRRSMLALNTAVGRRILP